MNMYSAHLVENLANLHVSTTNLCLHFFVEVSSNYSSVKSLEALSLAIYALLHHVFCHTKDRNNFVAMRTMCPPEVIDILVHLLLSTTYPCLHLTR